MMKKKRKGLLALWLAFFVTILSLPLRVSAENETLVPAFLYMNEMDDLENAGIWYLYTTPHSISLNTPLDSQLDISDFRPYAGHIHDGWLLWGHNDCGVIENYDMFYAMDGMVTAEDYQALTFNKSFRLLILPHWKCKYEVTHQPLPAEPYISTNVAGSCQWHSVSYDEYDRLVIGSAVTGQNTTAFTGDAGTYVCRITYDDYTLTSQPVTIRQHTVTKEAATNGSYTLSVNGRELSSSSADPTLTSALSGQRITVTSTPASGYMLSSVAVTAADGSGKTVPVDQSNCFIMPDYPVTVGASFALQTFEIKLPEGDGFHAAVMDGQTNPVSYGGSCSFTLTIADGYTASDRFMVTANGHELVGVSADGISYHYTITDITKTQSILVTGIDLIPAPEPEPPTNTDTPGSTVTPGNTTPPVGTDTPSTGAPVNNGNSGASILSAGVTSLISGTAYRLGSGKWTVAGDNTLYEGGSVFYVTNSGSYDFRPQ